MKQKIFGIGFHKTGTTSLAAALRMLGYRVTGPNGVRDPDISSKALDMAFELAEQYDAFQDNPWPLLYKEMDKRYPGSKFILTLRRPETWIKSQVAHFGERETSMRKWIYGAGCPKGNEAAYIARFEKHTREVLDYFKDRPNDLLVMELAKGHGWKELCTFLKIDLIDTPFPHCKEARDKKTARKLAEKTRQERLRQRIRRRISKWAATIRGILSVPKNVGRF